jgi:transglutaminase-like putative cysteine protease
VTRRHLAASIFFIWFVTLGWLVRREFFRPRAELLAEAALTVSPGATYYEITLASEQIGYASNKIDTLTDAIRLEDQMLLQVPALGSIERVDARTEVHLTRALVLTGFDATLRSGSARFAAQGRVSGDSLLTVVIESGDSRRTLDIPLREPLMLPGLLPLQLAFGGGLEVGNTLTLQMFDPLVLAKRDLEVTVTAESTFVVPDSAALDAATATWVAARWDTLRAWRVVQRMSGLAVETWIDGLGQVVEATSPMGFRMRRTAFEIAYENFRRREPQVWASSGSDIIGRTAIASNVRLDPAGLAELRVRLGGVELAGFDLSGGRQRLAHDTLVIRREPSAALRAGYQLPTVPPDLRAFLEPDPLIQSDDPRIRAQARQIVRRERDPARAADMLMEWVYGEVDKRVTIGIPSAIEVFESRRGDCNEHTVLYVALARATGLPARTAAGLVYADGSFYYHAWAEVYLDNWVAVDPTFGQFPADAAHLRFTIGGLARQVELVRLIGQLSLEIVQTRGESGE